MIGDDSSKWKAPVVWLPIGERKMRLRQKHKERQSQVSSASGGSNPAVETWTVLTRYFLWRRGASTCRLQNVHIRSSIIVVPIDLKHCHGLKIPRLAWISKTFTIMLVLRPPHRYLRYPSRSGKVSLLNERYLGYGKRLIFDNVSVCHSMFAYTKGPGTWRL